MQETHLKIRFNFLNRKYFNGQKYIIFYKKNKNSNSGKITPSNAFTFSNSIIHLLFIQYQRYLNLMSMRLDILFMDIA